MRGSVLTRVRVGVVAISMFMVKSQLSAVARCSCSEFVVKSLFLRALWSSVCSDRAVDAHSRVLDIFLFKFRTCSEVQQPRPPVCVSQMPTCLQTIAE